MVAEQDADDFFTIEFDSLIEKWSTFAKDYFHKAVDLADARAEMERTKRIRDVTRAELYQEICNNPEEFGLAKTTETSVEMAITRHERFKEAGDGYYKAKHALDVHQAFVDAMDVLKKGMEAHTYLWQSCFGAEPKAKGEGKHVAEKAAMNRAFSGTQRRLET